MLCLLPLPLLPQSYLLELASADTPQYLEFVPALTAAYNALWAAELPASLLVDVAQCAFLTPGHLVALACLVESYHLKGILVEMSVAENEVHEYLRHIRFFDYWQPGFDRRRYTPNQLDTNLCLWQVDARMIDAYAHQAKAYFAQNFLPGKNLDVLHTSLAELFNNICDHAQSSVQGYCFTQYYPKRQQLVTAVCDFGMGIPTSINRLWQAQGRAGLPDADALRASLRRGLTTRSTPRNRGFGLDSLATSARAMQGELTFVSNFAQLEQLATGEVVTKNPACFFPGTLIVVTLNTASLPAVEEELEADEFSF